MRHTHIRLLAKDGLPNKDIMERVGHSKPDTNFRIYHHATQTMEKQRRKVLNNRLGSLALSFLLPQIFLEIVIQNSEHI